jgi:hypothetical protein
VRRVQADCCIELDTNRYSVPWRLIGENVQVVVASESVSIRHAGREVAAHAETNGRHRRMIQPSHFAGVVGGPRPAALPTLATLPAELLRPLCEYEQLIGGGF